MNRAVIFSIFIAVFLAAYGALNYYALWRIFTLFNLKRGALLYSILLTGTLSFFIATIIERYSSSTAAKTIYIVAVVWMGAIFILASVLALHEIIRIFTTLPNSAWGIIASSVATTLIIIALVCGNIIRIHYVTMQSEKIEKPLRIAQISDLHIGSIRGDSYVADVIAKVKAQNPDIVVITGDLIDGPGKYNHSTIKRFETIGVPVYFVTGNHEGFTNKRIVDDVFANTTIIRLDDEKVSAKGIEIIGISDRDSKNEVKSALDGIQRDNTKFRLLLYHRPSASKVVTDVDLMLSGHTHNGQIIPFNFLTWLVERPLHGLHDVNGFKIYVNQGTGTWGPPMRLGSTNEIAIIRLVPA